MRHPLHIQEQDPPTLLQVSQRHDVHLLKIMKQEMF